MPYKIPTAHHQQQDDQQRGHEHQQGQPHVVPHLESLRVGAGSAAGGRAAGRHGQHGRREPEGSAPRGRGWAVRGRTAAGTARRPAPRPGRPSRGRSGPRGATTASSLGGAGGHGVQRPAANGRAAMADTEGESVSWKWPGGRKALAVASVRSPRPSETPDVNRSPRPPRN